MKYVSSIITAKPGDEDKTRKSLQKVLAPIRKEKGIISFSIYERNDQLGTFVTHEVLGNNTLDNTQVCMLPL